MNKTEAAQILAQELVVFRRKAGITSPLTSMNVQERMSEMAGYGHGLHKVAAQVAPSYKVVFRLAQRIEATL